MAGKGVKIAVLTSGGDSQGMNAALRAIVRLALYQHAEVVYVEDGYQGMIAGTLVAATWESVGDIIHRGGTFIGSARSKEFTTRQGRAKAAANLARCGINALICVGGDGSLTGLQMLQSEWSSHMEELCREGVLTREEAEQAERIAVVGIVGSIDNDFAGSERTIGADSALSRIVEAVDAVVDTAQSHQRTFVIEVMGRHCGYLALTAALATEADYVFVPEWPPAEEWREKMCTRLNAMRQLGRRLNVIIVAEGAMDVNRKKITAEDVQKVVEERLKHDVRVTKLGHVQRGGRVSFLDRMLATRMGAEAVATVLEPSAAHTASVIVMEGNQLKRVSLTEAIKKNQKVAHALKHGKLDEVAALRGQGFIEKIQFMFSTRMENQMVESASEEDSSVERFTPTASDFAYTVNIKKPKKGAVAIMHVGAPAAGMNAATHAFVRCALAEGLEVYGILESLSGLAKGKFIPLDWASVSGWVSLGGSMLGTKKELPEEPYSIAGMVKNYGLRGLCIVGGFEAFSTALALGSLRSSCSSLRIPIVVIPATISNNVPGTRVSLGSDTALNEISRMMDILRQSAFGTRGRSFIVETQGGKCGYLAAMGAMAGAADDVHIFEERVNKAQLDRNIAEASHRVHRRGARNYLLVRGEGCHLTTQQVEDEFRKKGKDMTTRKMVLGHVQQGHLPSVLDRQMGVRMGTKAASVLVSLMDADKDCKASAESIRLIGLTGSDINSTRCEDLKAISCFAHRMHSDSQWWRRLNGLTRIIASDAKEVTGLTKAWSSEESVRMGAGKDEQRGEPLSFEESVLVEEEEGARGHCGGSSCCSDSLMPSDLDTEECEEIYQEMGMLAV